MVSFSKQKQGKPGKKTIRKVGKGRKTGFLRKENGGKSWKRMEKMGGDVPLGVNS